MFLQETAEQFNVLLIKEWREKRGEKIGIMNLSSRWKNRGGNASTHNENTNHKSTLIGHKQG
jgi:sulfatase maturation enzyme AslB (radical SAM superfamily)